MLDRFKQLIDMMAEIYEIADYCGDGVENKTIALNRIKEQIHQYFEETK